MVWVDLGGARVQQPQSVMRSAGSVGGGLWHARGPVAFAAEGNVTMADDSISAAQWVVRTTLTPAALPWSRTDIDVSTTTNGIVLPGSNGNRALNARHTWQIGAVNVFGSAGVGRTERLFAKSEGHALGGGLDAGRTFGRGSARGEWRAGVTMQRSYSNDWQLMERSGIVLSRDAEAYTIDDVTPELSWRNASWWVSASRAWRTGRGATTGTAQGFHLAAAWQFTPSAMLIVQGGEQLADAVRGVPQARYTGVSLRWNPLRPRALRRDARALADTRSGNSGGFAAVPDIRGDEVLVQRAEGTGTVVITIAAAANAVVEVACSNTEWTPVRVARAGDAFVHRLSLPSGSHKLAVRINGGEWRAPRGLVAVEDDFGTRAGMIVIP